MPARRVSDEEQLSSHLHPHTQATSGTEMLPQQQSNRRVTFEPELDSTQVGTNTKNEGERDDSKMPAVNTSSSDMDTGAYRRTTMNRVGHIMQEKEEVDCLVMLYKF